MNEKSTVRSRELGIELRAQREAQDLTLREIARRADWSAAKVSAWENGRRVSAIDAAIYLANCGAKGAERRRLLELTKPPSDLYWVRPYFDTLVDPMRSLIIQENLATSMIYYSPVAIPGMLQTEDYVRSIFELTGRYTADRLKVLVKARIDRQRLFERNHPPRCVFYVHERALHSMTDHRLMQEQLQYLLLAANVPCSSVRIVPESAAAFRTIGSTFTVMEFADHPPVIYEETYAAGLFVDDRIAVEAFYILAARLEQDALPARESRDLLVRLADEHERAKG